MPYLRLEAVSRAYATARAEVMALREVDLSVDEGEFVAIMGPSGSGKSTLMGIVGCLDRPTGGRYALAGRPTCGLDDQVMAELRNREIGFVFQQFHLLSRETALDNVALPLIYTNCGHAERQRRGAEMLERVGLGNRLHHRPHELSGGQQQRVAIARALVTRPRLLLADEPTGALDSETAKEILKLLSEINQFDATVIIVTHDPLVAAATRRTVRLCDGRIAGDERHELAAAPC
jgi:putative ABC transport system ATP-binding protein